MFLGFTKDENGKLVSKFVKEDDLHNPEYLFRAGAEFGDYIWTDEDHIEVAKETLLERMFDAIRKIAKLDEFWIVKRPSDFENSETESFGLFQTPKEAKEGKCTVGVKFHLPQTEGYYPFEEREQIQKRFDECMSEK